MGDLHRHAEVFWHVQQAVTQIRPDEDYLCLEIGNYLTDVSQFRDPFAHMLAKRTVWGQGLGSIPVLPYIPVIGLLISEAILNWAIDLDEWIDRMFGVHEPASRRYGRLAEYFQGIVRGITHLAFSDDVPNASFWHGVLRPAGSNL
ncbi:MAG: hypothetical protein JWP95_904, partial [Actinotalea sp.]|nr:hypothetical protein [Actinotalea sp.]